MFGGVLVVGEEDPGMPTRIEPFELWSHVAYPHGSAYAAEDPERKPIAGPEGAKLLAEHAVRILGSRDCKAEVVPLDDPDFGRAMRAFVAKREGMKVVDEAAGEVGFDGGISFTIRFLRVSPKMQNVEIAWVLQP
jgi:hypothetical protein